MAFIYQLQLLFKEVKLGWVSNKKKKNIGTKDREKLWNYFSSILCHKPKEYTFYVNQGF